MKKNRLLITTVLFFLIVNTIYYWEGKLGFWTMPVMLILLLVYIGLIIAVLVQLYFSIRERFTSISRLALIAMTILVLILTYLKPFGLINFEKFESDDILVANREGAANCMTTLKLKSNFTFHERNVCFGVTEIKGKYHLQNDTIFFDNVDYGRHEKNYFEFAVIRPLNYNSKKKYFELTRYKDVIDTVGYSLTITKNELRILK